MIIKSLKLLNFRQFKGETFIEFSTDPNRKATIIMAENAAGKTTLIESFHWIFYGTTDLKSIWNKDLLNECEPGKCVRIEGYIILVHNNVEYHIKRIAKKWKNNKTFSSDPDVYEIEYVDSEGISQKKRDKDAIRLIKEIVQEDLFSYFFFKGEKIEKIGKDMAGINKSVESKEFINAVRGLLGFSSFYNAIKHLKNLSLKYNREISDNNNDAELADIAKKIEFYKNKIEEAQIALDGVQDKPGLKDSLNTLVKQKNEKSDEIASYKVAEVQQKRTIDIEKELEKINNKIYNKQKDIFLNFSSKSYDFFASKLIEIARDTLKHEDAIDKGIPNMDSRSLDYILNVRKHCLCGAELIPGTTAYNNVESFRKFVPPVGIGTEIEMMKNNLDNSERNCANYYDDFKKNRSELIDLEDNRHKLQEELARLNEEIKNIPDVSSLKQAEKELESRIIRTNIQITKNQQDIEDANSNIASLEKQKENYSTSDIHIQRLLKYQNYCDECLNTIKRYCKRHEDDKKVELQDAINQIFKEIFETDIQIVLNDKYEISISDKDMKTLEDLENSTSQDGIMAFSFIAGIIELAGRAKKAPSSDDLDEEVVSEPYPLVMDAPSSSFDKKRIKAFSNVLPRIAEQIIIFIKDTDGEYLENDLGSNVGRKYEIIKHDKYYSTIGGRE